MSEANYLEVLRGILMNGENREDRTGVGTRSQFGCRIEWDMRHSFPILTTKRVFWRGVVGELLWFLSGSGSIQELADRDIHIWDEWKGKGYAPYGPALRGSFPSANTVDQVHHLVEGLLKDPYGRRHVMTTWIPGDIARGGLEVALPPCHGLVVQYNVTNDGHLDCQVYQRSADMFLGVPFNLASYGLLTHMIARETGLIPGRLIWVGGDCHIYSNHFEQVREQLTRPLPDPAQLRIVGGPGNGLLEDYQPEDFELVDYRPLPTIKAEVAV